MTKKTRETKRKCLKKLYLWNKCNLLSNFDYASLDYVEGYEKIRALPLAAHAIFSLLRNYLPCTLPLNTRVFGLY